MTDFKMAANLLLTARTERKRLKELPEGCRPKSIDEAYMIQNELEKSLLANFGGKRIGYKVACTNVSAQQIVNVDGPFYGTLLSPFVYETPAALHYDDFNTRVIEPEFGFIMGSTLKPRKSHFKPEEVAEAIACVVPCIEVVDSRFEDWTIVGAPSLIADSACNAAWLKGTPERNWLKYDFVKHEVDLSVNGVAVRKGMGSLVLGNPLNVVTWLANALSRHGKELKAGDYISTGVTCDVYLAKLGDKIKADFGQIGRVEVGF